MYKLITIDLDGTLLDDSKVLSQENINALKECIKEDIKVVIATGRPLQGFRKYLDMIETKNNYVIAFNGAIICNKEGSIFNKTIIKGKDLKDIYKVALDNNLNIHAFDMNGCISPKMSKYTQHEIDINKIDCRIIDFNSIDDDLDIIKVMIVDEPSKLDNIDIPSIMYEKYNIVKSAPFFIEFMNKEVDKGKALLKVCDLLNIDPKLSVAFGDAENDLGMIKNAGLGIAMENAWDICKKNADCITLSNNNSGIANGIYKYVLKK